MIETPKTIISTENSNFKMTIKHEENIYCTELGDNKVMKQNVDDVFITAFIENDVKPNFIFDGLIYLIRIIYSACGFAVYFLYKDFFSFKDMTLLLCISYYLLCGVDYIVSYLVIKKSFLIGSLPSGSRYCDAQDFRAESVCDFGDYDYKLKISATLNDETVEYQFSKPIGSYFETDGLLRSDIIREDVKGIMENFRTALHDKASKKNN